VPEREPIIDLLSEYKPAHIRDAHLKKPVIFSDRKVEEKNKNRVDANEPQQNDTAKKDKPSRGGKK
jgi:hypothetical protein